MKSTSVVIGLLTGCIIAAACGYFDRTNIDSAPAASFIWVHTFKLTVYGPLVLPLLAVFIICATEAVGDITATCDVSRLEVMGKIYESRIQGGVVSDRVYYPTCRSASSRVGAARDPITRFYVGIAVSLPSDAN